LAEGKIMVPSERIEEVADCQIGVQIGVAEEVEFF